MWVYTEGRDKPNNARCASCDAPVTWVRNIMSGKRQPIDDHDIGLLRVDTRPDRDGDSVACGEVDFGGDSPMHTSHFASCPERDQWRKRR